MGGVALEPPLGFFDRVRHFAGYFPDKVDEYENLLTGNPIWGMRTKGVAKLSAEDAIALGASGPTLRGSGIDFDLRRDMPYTGYENFKFKVPLGQAGDVFDRYMCRVRELRESIGIDLDGLAEEASRLLRIRRAMDLGKSREEATQIMLHVHRRGVGVCGVYTYEVAETKVTQVIDFARRHQHPLQCTMEKE